MNKLAITLLLGSAYFSPLQSQNAPDTVYHSYKLIISLILKDQAAQLAPLVSYPLARTNPLPNINTQQQFIENFPLLFDKVFKERLKLYDDSCVFYRNGVYGLVGGAFNGDIWISEDGKILAINSESAEEFHLRQKLIQDIKSRMYPSIRDWTRNVLVAKSKNVLIRIDETGKGLRYVSWTKGQSISEKPDLILLNGVGEPQGSAGGWLYTFRSGKWTYVVEDNEMCAGSAQCGLFLRLIRGESEFSYTKLESIK